MRPLPCLFFGLVLMAGTVLSPVSTPAQTPAPPPVIPAAPVPDLAPLLIPSPPGAKLRVEMDARSEDLLGLVKSFLKGIGETGPAVIAASGPAAAPPNPVAQAIANGDLAAMLKDVNHVHFAVYEVAGPAPAIVLPTLPLKPGVKKSAFAAPVPPPVMSDPPVAAFDSNSFYENAFAAEGAHRLLYTDADAYKLVMVGFPNRHGFAFAASGGGYVIVERSDGYPDLEILSAFISRVSTAVLNSETAKKAMKSALDSGKEPVPEAKTLGKK